MIDSCLEYGSNPPFSIWENTHFSFQKPYLLRYKRITEVENTPIHYSDTMEVVVCQDIFGYFVIDDSRYEINGDSVFVVPPSTLHHSFLCPKSKNSSAYVLQLCFRELNGYVNFDIFFNSSGHSINAFVQNPQDSYTQLLQLIQLLIEYDQNLYFRMSILLQLIGSLPTDSSDSDYLSGTNSKHLHEIVKWTLDHYTEKITLDSAARVIGYTTNYYCSWFKQCTHQNFSDYLTDIRISFAIRTLTETGSISKACFENGFHGLSYFAQVFKRKTGYTPSQYLKEHKKVLQSLPSAELSQSLLTRNHNVQTNMDHDLPQWNPFMHISAFTAVDKE